MSLPYAFCACKYRKGVLDLDRDVRGEGLHLTHGGRGGGEKPYFKFLNDRNSVDSPWLFSSEVFCTQSFSHICY